MSYMRVLPRDLFNEAKLLKCMGMLSLLIHDELIPLSLHHDLPNDGFNIRQDLSGNIFIDNILVTDKEGEPLEFYTPLNSRQPWPLIVIANDRYIEVFNEDGSLTNEFKNLLNI